MKGEHPAVEVNSEALGRRQAPEQALRDRKTITLPNGSKREIYGYGPTKQAATRDLYEKVAVAQAQATALDSITVTQAMAKLARHKRTMKGRKARTIHNDLYNYRKYVQESIGSRPIAAVTVREIQEIQAGLTGRGKWRTAELVTVLLRSIWRHTEKAYASELRAGTIRMATYRDEIEQPTRPVEAVHVPNEPWTVDQLEAFLGAAKTTYDKAISNLLYPVFHTAIAAGLRLGELLGLEQGDLEETENGHELVIRRQLPYYAGKHHRESTKTPAGTRRVPVGPELVAVLEAHKAKLRKVAGRNPRWAPNRLMFPGYHGRPLEPNHLYRAKKQILEELELPHSTLHDMRSVYTTYVTRELVRQGKYSPKLVMRLLGHSDAGVALKHYNRVVKGDLVAATFDPTPKPETGVSKTKTGIRAGTGSKEKDAESLETAS